MVCMFIYPFIYKAGPRPGITSHGDEGLIETIPWTAEIEDEEEGFDDELERRFPGGGGGGGVNRPTTRERTITSSSTASSTSRVKSEGKEMVSSFQIVFDREIIT